MWIEGPHVPVDLEGRAAWKWVDVWGEKRKPIMDVIPTGFSREPWHCGGVWFFPIDRPAPPAPTTQEDRT